MLMDNAHGLANTQRQAKTTRILRSGDASDFAFIITAEGTQFVAQRRDLAAAKELLTGQKSAARRSANKREPPTPD